MGLGLGAIAGIASVGMGLAKSIGGAIQAKKYKNAINDFKFTERVNPYENLKVSTLGAMQQQANAAQNTSSAINALRQGGAAALMGGVGKVQNQNNLVNQNIAAGLDQQQNRNEMSAATMDERLQNQQLQIEQTELAGLGKGLDTARAQSWSGAEDALTGGLVAAGGMGLGGGAGGGATSFGGVTATDPNSINLSSSSSMLSNPTSYAGALPQWSSMSSFNDNNPYGAFQSPYSDTQNYRSA